MTDILPNADKQQIRQQFRRLRRALPDQNGPSLRAARCLAQLPGWAQMKTVALYIPTDGELDPGAIAAQCRDSKRRLLLPRLKGAALEFAVWEFGEKLTANRFGIGEPPQHQSAVPLGEIDLLCLPLVAYDRLGTRLGMGGGFYDRSLQDCPARVTLMGLAHTCQEAKRLPKQAWDQSLHWVLNDGELIDCRRQTTTPTE